MAKATAKRSPTLAKKIRALKSGSKSPPSLLGSQGTHAYKVDGERLSATSGNFLTLPELEFERAASSARNVWIAFVSLGSYLFIATLGITHRDLFFERPVRLPLFGVDVPLVLFFGFAPFLLLCFHVYLLFHLLALHEQWMKLNTKSVSEGIPRSEVEKTTMYPLESMFYLKGQTHSVRIREFANDITITTVVVAPVLLLLMMQLFFLPYHQHTVVWFQRLAIAVDIACLYQFWPRGTPSPSKQATPRGYFSRLKRAILPVTALFTLCFSSLIATFPGEPQDNNALARIPLPIFKFNGWVVGLGGWVGVFEIEDERYLPKTIYEALFNGPIDYRTGRRISLFSNSLILPNFDAVDDEKLERIENREAGGGLGRVFEPSLSMRGRDFQNAVFTYADMRHVDFLGADLRNADFTGALLSGARMSCQAINKGTYGFFCTRLQGSIFDLALVQDVDFSLAELQGASFEGAKLQSSIMSMARLQGANFTRAEAQGVSFLEAELTGATLDEAVLYGALLLSSTLTATSLRKAQIQGTWLLNANLDSADLREAYVWRSYGAAESSSNSIVEGLITGPVWKMEGEFSSGNDPLTAKDFEQLKMWASVGVPKSGRARLEQLLERLNPDKPSNLEEISWQRIQAGSVSESQHSKSEASLLLRALCSQSDSAYILKSLKNAGRLERNKAISDAISAEKSSKTPCDGLKDLD